MGTFWRSPQEIQPLSGNGFCGVYMFHGLAKMFGARVVSGMGLNSAFPMVNRRETDFHVPLYGGLAYPDRFAPRAAEHINDIIGFLH
jgi:hypothetical protein